MVLCNVRSATSLRRNDQNRGNKNEDILDIQHSGSETRSWGQKYEDLLLPHRIRRPSRILPQTPCVFHYFASIGGVRRSAYTRMFGAQRIGRGVPVSRVGVGLEGSSPVVPV